MKAVLDIPIVELFALIAPVLVMIGVALVYSFAVKSNNAEGWTVPTWKYLVAGVLIVVFHFVEAAFADGLGEKTALYLLLLVLLIGVFLWKPRTRRR